MRDSYFINKVKAGHFRHDPTPARLVWLRAYLPLNDKYEWSGPLCCTVKKAKDLPKDEPVGICPINKKAQEILRKKNANN